MNLRINISNIIFDLCQINMFQRKLLEAETIDYLTVTSVPHPHPRNTVHNPSSDKSLHSCFGQELHGKVEDVTARLRLITSPSLIIIMVRLLDWTRLFSRPLSPTGRPSWSHNVVRHLIQLIDCQGYSVMNKIIQH